MLRFLAIALLTGTSWALERPVPLNGYLPAVDEAACVIWPATGDTCRAGYTNVTLPTTCVGGTTLTGNETNTQLETILNNPSNGPVFCAPVDAVYDFTTGQRVDITRDCSGEPGGRCYLVPEDTGTRTLHPLLAAESPSIRYIDIEQGAHGWVIAGWKLGKFGSNNGNATNINVGPDDTTVNNTVIAHNLVDSPFLNGYTGGDGAVTLYRSDGAIVAYNIIKDVQFGSDGQVQGLRIRRGNNNIAYRNLFQDAGIDAIIFSRQTVANSVPGTRVINNVIWFTQAMRVPCSGTFSDPTGSGNCGCQENALDAKSGASDANPAKVRGNVVRGLRRTRTVCGGSSGGEAFVNHFVADSIEYSNNWIVDVIRGITGANGGVENDGNTVSANVIEVVADPIDDGALHWAFFPNNWGAQDYQLIAWNTVVAKGSGHTSGYPAVAGSSDDHDMTGNLFIGFQAPQNQTGNVNWGGNLYVNTPVNTLMEAGTDDSANSASYDNVTIETGFAEMSVGPVATYTINNIRPYVGAPELTGATYTPGRGAANLLPPVRKAEGAPDGDTYGALAPITTSTVKEYYTNLVGSEVIELGGQVWDACDSPTGDACQFVNYNGGIVQNPGTILNAPADQAILYNTMLIDFTGNPEMSLNYPMANGDYRVDLHFVEDSRTTGQRTFHVDIEGNRALTDFDIYATAGAFDTAEVQSFFVGVTDNELNVDFTTVIAQPTIAALAVYPYTVPGSRLVPLTYNDIQPATGDVAPVLLPGAGDQCRAGYSCITPPTSCSYTFTGSETENDVETALNNASNGANYCVPIGTDWRSYSIDVTRDCTSEVDGRCWIVPTDMATRSLNAGLVSSPLLRKFTVGDGAHGWSVAGLVFTNVAFPQEEFLFGVAAGNSADNLVLAHSYLLGVGTPAAGPVAAVSIRGNDWSIYGNRIHDSAVRPNTSFDGIGYYSGIDSIIHRNEIKDMAGRGIYLAGVTSKAQVINNDIRVTDALRTAEGGTTPGGAGPYNCAGALIYAEGGPSSLANEANIYGNTLHGSRLNAPTCGGEPEGISAAITVGANAQYYNINWNLIFNAHAGISGAGGAEANGPSTVSSNVVDLDAFGDGISGYSQSCLSPEKWGGGDQIFAYNLCLCRNTGSNGPFVWETGTADADIAGNSFIGCAAPGGAAESGSKLLSNVYTDNGIDGSVETPIYDDSGNRGTYTSVAFYAGICEYWPAGCPTIVFPQIVPPAGSPRTGIFTGLTFTAGRGASPPKQYWGEF